MTTDGTAVNDKCTLHIHTIYSTIRRVGDDTTLHAEAIFIVFPARHPAIPGCVVLEIMLTLAVVTVSQRKGFTYDNCRLFRRRCNTVAVETEHDIFRRLPSRTKRHIVSQVVVSRGIGKFSCLCPCLELGLGFAIMADLRAGIPAAEEVPVGLGRNCNIAVTVLFLGEDHIVATCVRGKFLYAGLHVFHSHICGKFCNVHRRCNRYRLQGHADLCALPQHIRDRDGFTFAVLVIDIAHLAGRIPVVTDNRRAGQAETAVGAQIHSATIADACIVVSASACIAGDASAGHGESAGVVHTAAVVNACVVADVSAIHIEGALVVHPATATVVISRVVTDASAVHIEAARTCHTHTTADGVPRSITSDCTTVQIELTMVQHIHT